MKRAPIKRTRWLQPLSREHHHGLVLCRKIRAEINKETDLVNIESFVDLFYIKNLMPHFQLEEQVIFPVLGAEHDLIKQAIEEHIKLHKLFQTKKKTVKTFELIERTLEEHIRFEERVLFPKIEEAASEKGLVLPAY